MLKKRLILIFASGISMSVFYLCMEFHQSFSLSFDVVFIILYFGLVFADSYGLFALPIKMLLNKYLIARKFNITHLVVYLVGSFIVYSAIHGIFNNYKPFYTNLEFFLYIFISALVFWTWDSIIKCKEKRRPLFN